MAFRNFRVSLSKPTIPLGRARNGYCIFSSRLSRLVFTQIIAGSVHPNVVTGPPRHFSTILN